MDITICHISGIRNELNCSIIDWGHCLLNQFDCISHQKRNVKSMGIALAVCVVLFIVGGISTGDGAETEPSGTDPSITPAVVNKTESNKSNEQTKAAETENA